MRALLLTTVLPAGRKSGGEVVTHGIAGALRRAGHEVLAVGYRRPDGPASGSAGEICVGRRPIETAAAGSRALAWMARALVSRDAYSSAKYRSRAYVRTVREQVHESDLVIADHAQVRFAVPAGVRLVFVAHNVEATLHRRLAEEGTNPVARAAHRREARMIGTSEAELARRADQVWALTTADAAHFRSWADDVRTLDVAPAFVAAPRREEPRYDVGLIGTWTWEANAAGLRWFLADVLPRLGALTVALAGAGSERWGGTGARMAAHGVVPDAAAFLSRARVVAVPATAGAGVQVKTLDAIASGVPVVATSVAVRGLGELPRSVVVADRAHEFAAAVARLVDDCDHERLRADALAWARARRDRFERSVADWVAELAALD